MGWGKDNQISPEAVVRRGSVKKVFLKNLQNSQENTYARVFFSFFKKSCRPFGLRPVTLLKKRVWHRCFPVNSAKFLKTPFLAEQLR